MKKLSNIYMSRAGIKLISWDLDGTLFDTESQWVKNPNMSEEEAEKMYRTIGYRANADKALWYFKNKGVYQAIINQCELTNKAMIENPSVISQFKFENFDSIISDASKSEMYLEALELAKISDNEKTIGIDDLPDGLEAVKKAGMTAVWARNLKYPFSKNELKDIEKLADFYIEDFSELVR